jgi:hypothetical protein
MTTKSKKYNYNINAIGNLSINNVNLGISNLFSGSFSASNNVTSPSNVTGLVFTNADTRFFQCQISVSITRTSGGNLYETFTLEGNQTDSGWNLYTSSINDITGIVFTITTDGQVQYTSTDVINFSSSMFCYTVTQISKTGTYSHLTTGTQGTYLLNSVQITNTIGNTIGVNTGAFHVLGGSTFEKNITVKTTDNASSFTSGGGLTLLGGAAISKNLLVNGNLGIGIENPEYNLDINGNARISTSITSASIYSNIANIATGTIGTLLSTNSNVTTSTVGTLISSNANITTVSGGTVVATTYTGGSMSLSGNLTLAGTLTTVNITTTNISETNVSAGSVTATNVGVTTGTIGTLLSTNANVTTGTIGTLLSTNANVTTGTVGTLLSTNANVTTGTIGTLLSTNANVTTGTIGTLLSTTSTVTNANVTTGTIGTLVGSSVTATNIGVTTCTIGTLLSTTSTVTNANVTTGTVGTLLSTNATVTTGTIGTLVGSSVTATNIEVTTCTIGTLLSTTATVTNANVTTGTVGTLLSTNANVTTGTIGTLVGSSVTATNIGVTTSTIGKLLSTNADISSGTVGTLLSTNANITTLSVGSLALSNVNVSTGTIGELLTTNLLAVGNSNTVGNIFTTGGNVGIGTISPGSVVDVKGSSVWGTFRMAPSISGGEVGVGFFGLNDFTASAQSTSGNWLLGTGISTLGASNFGLLRNTTPMLAISTSGNMTIVGDLTVFGSISDARWKKDITVLSDNMGLNVINSLRPVTFTWKDEISYSVKRGKRDVGFIAQEVEEVIEYVVEDYKDIMTDSLYKKINHERLIPYLTLSIQQLDKRFVQQQQEIEMLKTELESNKQDFQTRLDELLGIIEKMRDVM